jgi:hypothetical protein
MKRIELYLLHIRCLRLALKLLNIHKVVGLTHAIRRRANRNDLRVIIEEHSVLPTCQFVANTVFRAEINEFSDEIITFLE